MGGEGAFSLAWILQIHVHGGHTVYTVKKGFNTMHNGSKWFGVFFFKTHPDFYTGTPVMG